MWIMSNIEVTQPTAQYTPGGDYALIQFQWRTVAAAAPAGAWHGEHYSPTQAQLSARAPAELLAIAPGAWGDAELRADVRDWITAQYGFTEITFLDVAS
jgi:hypothetical protein